MMDKVAFTSNKMTLAKYLEQKAARKEAQLAESISEAGRAVISKNQKASKAGQFIPEDAYFGEVPAEGRNIGREKTMNSVAATKQNVDAVVTEKAEEAIIPENSINYIA